MINNDNIEALKLTIDTLEMDVIQYMKSILGRKSFEYREVKEDKIKYFNLLRDYLNLKKVNKAKLFFKDIVAISLYFYMMVMKRYLLLIG